RRRGTVPELPEVETVRSDLEREVAGRIVRRVEALGVRTLRRESNPARLRARLQGRRLTAVGRRGKYLILRFGGDDAAVVHLGMSGQLLWAAPGTPRPRHTHVVWDVDDGWELRFVDPRTFGAVFLSAGPGPDGEPAELAHLGAEPLDPRWTIEELRASLARRRSRLKPLLLGQRVVAGLGNLYTDEILWEARLGPERAAGGLTGREVGRLHAATREILTSAIAHRGSSLADEQYRDLYGRLGGYRPLHRVYAREGAACPRCGGRITRAAWLGRSTFSCARCQG
ncbi:MAG TPA: bifunctional DNA-formamidopyrimidine glycosylase/DNA-(apurinic or apyrimidinic site) lyase, partial [Acidimicrobiales bacterium]|nr:bifunctional DNA-formamidopyrimidine glycosylase/DNA-(apurinic or apyrimidinic site) lyase [Acidimicrobiales bacterium]